MAPSSGSRKTPVFRYRRPFCQFCNVEEGRIRSGSLNLILNAVLSINYRLKFTQIIGSLMFPPVLHINFRSKAT